MMDSSNVGLSSLLPICRNCNELDAGWSAPYPLPDPCLTRPEEQRVPSRASLS
ncbi:hypothetical protein K3X13_10360 [Aliiroseovarius crassostreae]|uniref:hypothetical protein n=1 Tax=Aliiroseovarius crassostreae TaxID=154981 RepID=UPI00220247E8|nr:hypothetical protein [Aliiroseovarius crassostreae]UWP91468.1 hypothetical protein K3X13_10360 [Aliiroseovarius crassostreae]